jgi:hypothetical protein
MNGRRDFGIAMAEWNDGRQLRRENNDYTFAKMSVLCLVGLAAIYFEAFIPGLVLIGIAVVIGIVDGAKGR